MASMNTTRGFHKRAPVDLMKEYTICEAFSSPDSPYMLCLKNPRPYGALIGDFLISKGILKRGATVMEIGGGYGSLMHGLLSAHADFVKRVVMVDLSKSLLNRQRRKVGMWDGMVTFIQADIHELIHAISGVDLIILNEVIGDLDAWIDLDPQDLPHDAGQVIDAYGLEIPASLHFNLNIGAITLVEAICRKKIPIFIAEHASDPLIPKDMQFLGKGLNPDAFPREIRLVGHSEFTIRFSHLVAVARAFQRRTMTGALMELIGLKKSPGMNFIFSNRACANEAQEIIFELLDHIREYRWFIMH
jgi:hypothetical protein